MTDFRPEVKFGEGEAMLRRETIRWIQSLRYSHQFRDRTAQMGTPSGFPDSPGQYVMEDMANDIVPIQHDRLALRPLVHNSPVRNIALLHLYVPTPYYERATGADEYVTRETPQWNDVFIEPMSSQEVRLGKYFMNSRLGPITYETATMEAGRQADIVRSGDFETSGDFFTTGYAADLAPRNPDFDLPTLRQILGSYTVAKQGEGV